MCVCFLFQDFSCTNAGIGSNLTKSGVVESDASIMDGESLTFGAVGALKGQSVEWWPYCILQNNMI